MEKKQFISFISKAIKFLLVLVNSFFDNEQSIHDCVVVKSSNGQVLGSNPAGLQRIELPLEAEILSTQMTCSSRFLC